MLRKVIKFTLVICCMLIIFMFSSDSGTASSKKSDSVIINLVEVISNKKVNNKDRDKYIEKYVFPVRKCAHFTIYLILGILVISLLSEYRILNFKTVLYIYLKRINKVKHQAMKLFNDRYKVSKLYSLEHKNNKNDKRIRKS